MNGPLVEIIDLVKTFAGNERPALSHVNLRLAPGQIVGLVGPDGAGKTTLLRIIAGLMSPDSGSVRVHGQDPARSRDGIGYMPQRFGLYEDLTVLENLELNADLRGMAGAERAEAFDRLLSFTSLQPFTARLAGRLSGGMKQKLGLACTLLGRPRTLLLDEPGVGVDPISRRDLWRIVRELAATGLGILWSTAYMEEAAGCEQVLLLNEGEPLYSGAPEALTARMRDQCFLIQGATNRRELLADCLTDRRVQDASIVGHSVRIVLRDSGMPHLASFGAHGQTSVVPASPRLEDAFIEALGGASGMRSPLAGLQVGTPPAASDLPNAHEDIVVQAVDLTRRFGAFTAVDQVSFEVKRGEVFGLLGANGAGKSTTFRMLCGLLKPTSGRAEIKGISLHHGGSRARQHLGYMAQRFSLYGDLSVRQNLHFFSGAYGLEGEAQRRAVDEMLRVFKLAPVLDHSSDTLPLGFKQRLALACALMHRQQILFLDEPTSGVDPLARREFWSHINALVASGVTIVVTTHFMEEAEYCDRLALVHRGKVIASGRPEDLKALARTPHQPEPSMEQAFIHLVEAHPEAAA